ncbi:hypothetical protein TNCT_208301 [Trichonephila clavata]|uniref:Uncharacterized protein n=1 Tax=Trichonephila clavata TaxID=2740835 RepID=A0A8X6GHZ0_TRICU|nr:hypothetical protein TNCT_208301 [Trichonephila clavata]
MKEEDSDPATKETTTDEDTNVITAPALKPMKEKLVAEMADVSELLESKIKNFGKKKAASLQNLRDELEKSFGDRCDIAVLDDRIKKFLDKEFGTRKPRKRQRSPRAKKRSSGSKRKKRKTSARRRKKTKRRASKKKKTK